ncbi:hypothetical protein Si068_00321 [Streptococcus infantarius subsp. infantarius]|jgi:predicted transcriptional regulator|uniref:hypothetical protein n=1 Tax=Streptococcus thermophilus TaxID=1308 RepID=UPI00208FCDBF|nr:hypothetical protein [Streptococcus infantarius subsp. infantarius]
MSGKFHKGLQNINWYATKTEGAEELSKTFLTGSDFRLLFYLLSKINDDNQVKLDNYENIGNEIGMTKTTIKKSIMNLKANKIIAKDIEEVKTLFINPTFFYAGNHKQVEEKQKFFDKCYTEYLKNKSKMTTKK